MCWIGEFRVCQFGAVGPITCLFIRTREGHTCRVLVISTRELLTGWLVILKFAGNTPILCLFSLLFTIGVRFYSLAHCF